jgi:hypothetical protein
VAGIGRSVRRGVPIAQSPASLRPGRPLCGDVSGVLVSRWVGDDDEVVVVVAVLDENIDRFVRKAAREGTQLTGHLLIEREHHHGPDRHRPDACRVEHATRGLGVADEEMGDRCTSEGEDATAFEAHSRPAQKLTEMREGTGLVGECYFDIAEGAHASITVTST